MHPSATERGKLPGRMPQLHEMSVAAKILGIMSVENLPGKNRLAGIVTTAELKAAGQSATQIETLTRSGTLVHVRSGVYARAAPAKKVLAHPTGDHLLRTAAALAAASPGPGAAASHQTAAVIHGIDLLGRPGNEVILTRTPGRNRSGRTGVHVHSAGLPAAHVMVKYGMRVTTAARTIVDLARILEFRAGVVAADSALHRRLTTTAELASVVTACVRWPGVRRATEVVAFADGLAESALESIARVVFRDCGLPPPELQVWVGGAEAAGRVDFFWRRYWTVVEVDGLMKYSDPARAVLQLQRDKRLHAAGYEVVHFDWHEITENPAHVATTIRAAFRRGTLARPAANA